MFEYTLLFDNRYKTSFEKNALQAQEKIENIAEEASIEVWISELNAIAQKYTCSTRNFLMNYVENLSETTIANGACLCSFSKKNYKFPLITTLSVIENLNDADCNKYIELFTRISKKNNPGTRFSWKKIYQKAMGISEGLLTKQEAFLIGHGLRFDYDQMQNFLIRAMNNDGLCFAKSEDLIEAFCFMYESANNVTTEDSLKMQYAQNSSNIIKAPIEQKSSSFTKELSSDLKNLIQNWTTDSNRSVDQHFLDWILGLSSNLDVPSKTAYNIYRNLALYANELTDNIEKANYDSSAFDNIEQQESYIATSKKIITKINNRDYYSDVASDTDFYRVTNKLCTYANTLYNNPRNNGVLHSWRYASLNIETGKPDTVSLGKRLSKLLYGELFIEKADILFMLWYIMDIVWQMDDPEIPLNKYESRTYDRIATYWAHANTILKDSLLPPFYAPHMLEQSFLMAILYSDSYLKESPFEYYEIYCDSLLAPPQKRNRETTVDKEVTKAERTKRRTEMKQEYKAGTIDFEGFAELFADFFFKHIKEEGKYFFYPEGVYYSSTKKAQKPSPVQKVDIPYPSAKTGERFNQSNEDYSSKNSFYERDRFVYGLTLYLQDHKPEMIAGKRNKNEELHFTCRVTAEKNVTLIPTLK